jgi:DNA-directed RNA polymerase specialized sigma24 family protein
VQDVFVTAMTGSDRCERRPPSGLAGLDRRNRAIDFCADARGDAELVTSRRAGRRHQRGVAILAEIAALPEAYRETLVLRWWKA